jgi:2-keto-4-pentenoate hydratase
MGRDLPDRPLVVADILRATEFVVPGIEIVDSRVAGWNITITDTVADNASSGLHVLAPAPISLSGLDLKYVAMRLLADGVEVSSGSGAACLGHPVNAVVWLANTARRFGRPLREGDTVLSGALGPMAPVAPGTRYEAVIDGLGSVSVGFDRPEDHTSGKKRP